MKSKKEIQKELEWLLFVFFSFALTIHNVTLLPQLETELVRIALTISTIGMNLIVWVYYPFYKKREKNK